METTKSTTWLTVIVVLVLIACATVGSALYVMGSRNAYYKQQLEIQKEKFNQAQEVIDSLQFEKKKIIKSAALHQFKVDSMLAKAGIIEKNQVNTIKQNEKTIRNIDNWNADQLDSFFANSPGQKN